MDQRIESFLADVLALAGENPDAIRKGCERRSNNPSLKRPVFRLRRSKNPAADGPLPRIGEGRGDEERGAIWTGALCGPD